MSANTNANPNGVNISRDQIVIIENCFEALAQAIDPQSMPKDLAEQFMQCRQLVSGLADKADGGNSAGTAASNSSEYGGPK